MIANKDSDNNYQQVWLKPAGEKLMETGYQPDATDYMMVAEGEQKTLAMWARLSPPKSSDHLKSNTG